MGLSVPKRGILLADGLTISGYQVPVPFNGDALASLNCSQALGYYLAGFECLDVVLRCQRSDVKAGFYCFRVALGRRSTRKLTRAMRISQH